MDAELEKIAENIRSMEIQGATNTAIAVINALGDYVDRLSPETSVESAKTELAQTAQYLSTVRPTEPMARNGVRFLLKEASDAVALEDIRKTVKTNIEVFLGYIQNAKPQIVTAGQSLLDGATTILSHCHSDTVVQLIKGLHERNPRLSVITTETRPRFQGRITAKKLLDEGIDVTMIVDSAAASFIIDDDFLPVDAVLIGCDEFTVEGEAINKIGSLQLALAAKQGNKPIYVATPLLKAGTETLLSKPQIEKRPAAEVWKEAPEDLTIINPAFELVDHSLLTGYITEEGISLPNEVYSAALTLYPWLK